MASQKKKKAVFTKKEIAMIKSTPTKNLKDLAFAIGKNYDSVRRLKWRMENTEKDRDTKVKYQKKLRESTKLGAINKNTRWTKQEEEYLMSSEDNDVEIAKALGRTLSSVQIKRFRMNEEIKKKKAEEKKKAKNEKRKNK